MEVWKDIKGYEGIYQVSNFGQVRSLDRWIIRKDEEDLRFVKGKILKLSYLTKSRYPAVKLWKRNIGKHHYLHRLILSHFGIPPTNGSVEVCHYDGDEQNFQLSNLRWGTKRDNASDRARHGTVALGERCGSSKLTEEQVREIKEGYIPYKVSARELSNRYGVHINTVYAILGEKTWKGVGNGT